MSKLEKLKQSYEVAVRIAYDIEDYYDYNIPNAWLSNAVSDTQTSNYPIESKRGSKEARNAMANLREALESEEKNLNKQLKQVQEWLKDLELVIDVS